MAMEEKSPDSCLSLDGGKQGCISFKSVDKVVWNAKAVGEKSATIVSNFQWLWRRFNLPKGGNKEFSTSGCISSSNIVE
jgi:hypothetical protein